MPRRPRARRRRRPGGHRPSALTVAGVSPTPSEGSRRANTGKQCGMTLWLDPEIRHVACIGLMAAGKSTVGRPGRGGARLAAGRRRRGGRGPHRQDGGRARLRRRRGGRTDRGSGRSCSRRSSADEPSVLAAPGGIALDPEARKAIGAHRRRGGVPARRPRHPGDAGRSSDEEHDRPLRRPTTRSPRSRDVPRSRRHLPRAGRHRGAGRRPQPRRGRRARARRAHAASPRRPRSTLRESASR